MSTHNDRYFVEAWGKKRAQGSLRFILRQAAWYILVFATVAVVLDWNELGFQGAVERRILNWRVALYLVFGLLLGALNWWLMERQYRKALANIADEQ
ncbi:MAG: hypothetical protein JNK89_10415 [Saprospiraceae bacterium]|nr:hypothetical protein [Saprospiraceae bacterium]